MTNSPYALLLLLIPLAAIYPLLRLYHWATDRWKLVVEGVYVAAEDGYDVYTKHRTMMVPYGRKVRRSKTVIRFEDGRTFELRPRAEDLPPPGSRIRIMHNAWIGHRIEAVE